jgi:hypothetical protein
VLFSNAEVASFIQKNFEPAWETVRAVPLVRIDFGEGKVVNRTLHGNIATSVCTAEGKVVDIIPGIYDPATYLQRLRQFQLLVRHMNETRRGGEERVRAYHESCAKALKDGKPVPGFLEPGLAAGGGLRGAGMTGLPQAGFGGGVPPAGFAGGVAMGPAGAQFAGGIGGLGRGFGFKGGIEMPLKGVLAGAPPVAPPVVRPDPPIIARTGELSQATPAAVPAEERALWKRLEGDTRLNEAVRRRQIHELLGEVGPVKPEAITKRLYKEVLHADLDDPYLGLGGLLFGTYPFVAEEHGY